MLRHLTPKVGPGSCFLDWGLQQESGCTICPTEAVSPALDQKDMAIKPRMSLTRRKGQAVSEWWP